MSQPSSTPAAAPAAAGGAPGIAPPTSATPASATSTATSTATSAPSPSLSGSASGLGIGLTLQGPVQLPQLVIRNLGDRSYEKRKQAALEIEHQIKELNAPSVRNAEGIKSIISVLVKDFAYSTQSNHRKGGLIGLAATAIALMEDTAAYLEHLLPPVLKCFADQESRVRYYACEALYNITKVARGSVLLFFNEIFDGLCKLYADVDVDVKNGAQLLDRLIKDVVTESDHFDVDKFIPLLRERIRIKNPFIRQLLVGWITVLDSVPDIDMVSFLPEYLGGLFDMLSDPNKDIRQQAYAALAELLREITQTNNTELGPMVLILVSSSDSRDNFTRLTVLSWMVEFVNLGKIKLLSYVADMLGTALTCCADSEKEIRQKAEKLHESLLKLVQTSDQKLDIHPILNKVTLQLLNKWVPTRLAALRWISMLLTKMPGTLFNYLNELFPALLKTLQDPDDQVVRMDLEVLARISLNTNYALDNHNFQMVLHHIMQLFSSDRRFLETRGSLIIRQLCELLDAESIYRALSLLLVSHEDLEFASIMVQTLNLILLTSPELYTLRCKIKDTLTAQTTPSSPSPSAASASASTAASASVSASGSARPLFESLYAAWVHNPVSTLSLCLLAQSYDLASSLVFCISDLEVTVGSLMQLDKLVQLIESPIFIHLRLQLLEPQTYTPLIKTLYGILMLLPQSSAFVSLKTRLESVSPLAALSATYVPPASKATSAAPGPARSVSTLSPAQFQSLLQQFQHTQAKHQQARQKVYRDTSLLNRPPVDDLPSSSSTSSLANS